MSSTGDEDDEAKGATAPTVPRCRRCNGANGAAEPARRRRRAARPRPRRAIATRGKERAPEPKIEELVKEGQDVIVQVAKEPLGTKGARLTCHVTLPGRFLVFMPTVDHIGISRKIDSREERNRLRGIVHEFREQHNFGGGVIIRTAASGRPKDDILVGPELLPQDLGRDAAARRAEAARRSRSTRSRAWSPSCCATC